MKAHEVHDLLERIAARDDFVERSSELASEWTRSADSFDAVEPILRFMEWHPSLDFGMPGPLVHFVEQHYGRGYEQKLVESINRKPVSHTVWMLTRVINGTNEPSSRQRLVETMKGILVNPATDENARNSAIRFLSKLSV